MASFIIDAAGAFAQQIVPPPVCADRGKCVVIANNSPADTLFISTDQTELNNAKNNGQTNIGIPILAGEKVVIPWVTSAIYAVNYNGTSSTPQDVMSAIGWE